jgi:hypothetical protein
MARNELMHHACRDVEETGLPLEAQIGPGLRRAFPLPGDDDRFRPVLEALAQRGRRKIHDQGQT